MGLQLLTGSVAFTFEDKVDNPLLKAYRDVGVLEENIEYL